MVTAGEQRYRGELVRAAESSAETMSRGIQQASLQAEQMSRGAIDALGVFSETIQVAMHQLEPLITSSRAITERLPETQQAAMNCVAHNVQTSTRLAQDLLQCRTVHDLAQIQKRFVQDSLESIAEGCVEIMRATNGLLEGAIGAIEQKGRRGGGGEEGATVADIMSKEVKLITPQDSVQDAARMMGEEDIGILPVREGDRLVGMVTDRDIAIRVAATGKDAKETRVEEVMTPDVKYVFEDEDLQHVAENMAEQQIRRLPVMNREKRLVGIVSLGDMATEQAPHIAGQALSGIAQEGGQHTQETYRTAAGDKPKRGRQERAPRGGRGSARR